MSEQNKPYVHQEYPKSLYSKGIEAVVQSEAEEAQLGAEGYTDWNTDFAAMGGDAAASDEPEPLSREQLKEKAAELGYTFAGNVSNAKLAEMIAAGPKA